MQVGASRVRSLDGASARGWHGNRRDDSVWTPFPMFYVPGDDMGNAAELRKHQGQ
jgi:hypothetical protein